MQKIKPSGKGSFLRTVIRALGMDKSFTSHRSASPPMDADQKLGQPNNLNVQAYLIADNRKHEIESQKAMMIALSRHERWKAGGPV